MADTWIVCLIYTVILGPRRQVVSARGPGSIPGWAPIIHCFSSSFKRYNVELLSTSNMELYK